MQSVFPKKTNCHYQDLGEKCKYVKWHSTIHRAQDTVVTARPLPSVTCGNDIRPIGNARLLWCVPLFIQQKDLHTIPKWASPPATRLHTLHNANKMPDTAFISCVSDRSVSKAWTEQSWEKAVAMLQTPAKNSMHWTGIRSSSKQRQTALQVNEGGPNQSP